MLPAMLFRISTSDHFFVIVHNNRCQEISRILIIIGLVCSNKYKFNWPSNDTKIYQVYNIVYFIHNMTSSNHLFINHFSFTANYSWFNLRIKPEKKLTNLFYYCGLIVIYISISYLIIVYKTYNKHDDTVFKLRKHIYKMYLNYK